MSGPEAFGAHNLAFVEGLYEVFLADPTQVDAEWRALFEGLRREGDGRVPRPTRAPRSIFNPAPPNGAPHGGNGAAARAVAAVGEAKLLLQDRLDQLVAAFRSSGHLEAALDPLDRPREKQPVLDPSFYGLSEADLDEPCSYTSLEGSADMTVGQVVRRMRNTYCRSIGVQFTHMDDREARHWLQERMESTENRLRLTLDDQRHILTKLIDAEVFEQFIRKKFLGAKSFSLEGGESLIPLLDLAVERAAEQGIEEVVMGMAHRGRLNVLANIMHKHPREIFREFEDVDNERYWGRGDVKYHLGFRTDHVTRQGKKLRLRLAFNPSHLEFVSPLVLGRARARQDRIGDYDRRRVLPIVLHGDSAFAGQGITQETLNLSGLPGYHVGGTLHVIVNNQIGFTTPPELARSSGYATDVALMLRAPIFHVNGEDPESVAQVVRLAMDFRERFRSDVFIDLYCYRRHGHNEGDEPAFTQPLMYKLIRARPTVRQSYLDVLTQLPNGLRRDEMEHLIEEREAYLEGELSAARDKGYRRPEKRKTSGWPWKGFVGGSDKDVPEKATAVSRDRLLNLLRKVTEVPDDFNLMPKLRRVIVDQRLEMAAGERPLDWSAGEVLAYATLLTEGHHVRISGQDSGRGTFSHRHAVLRDQDTEEVYLPLLHLEEGQSWFEVWDSPLSENAVLAYDYGYSLDRPGSLVVWEAQFGDFANGAQVIIDQFISSAEDKWELLSGIALFLPHGFEGQGPEHSSARLERFLQLCAEDNMQVVDLTTPAQIFHCLRRQVVRPYRKPLIVMTPKSLLRHPRAVSTLDELATGEFQRVIPDHEPPEEVRRILLCSGRVYYDLVEYREAREHRDAAIIRVEQLYPFPEEPLRAEIEALRARGGDELEVVWVQEDPENMGAWWYLRSLFGERMFDLPLSVVARNASASPATGSPRSHKREQEFLVTRAFFGHHEAPHPTQQS